MAFIGKLRQIMLFFGFPLRNFHVLSTQNQSLGVNDWICGSIISEGFSFGILQNCLKPFNVDSSATGSSRLEKHTIFCKDSKWSKPFLFKICQMEPSFWAVYHDKSVFLILSIWIPAKSWFQIFMELFSLVIHIIFFSQVNISLCQASKLISRIFFSNK